MGGGEKGGIVVRRSADVNSELTGRLGTGAVVEELEVEIERRERRDAIEEREGSSPSQLQGNQHSSELRKDFSSPSNLRLRFRKLSGSGPETGWVSLKLQSGKELLSKLKDLWQVIGGSEKGGIIVREEFAVTSPECSSRLATGSIVQEIQLVNERLNYTLITGSGPDSGWVSISLQKKPLLCKAPTAPERFIATLTQLSDLSFQESLALFGRMNYCEQAAAALQMEVVFESADFRLKRKVLRCLSRMENEDGAHGGHSGHGAANGDTAWRVMLRATQDADATVRGEAVLTMATLLNAQNKEKREEQAGCEMQLEGLELQDSRLEKLLEALEDQDWRVRKVAAASLKDCSCDNLLSKTDVILAYARKETDLDVKKSLFALLASLGHETVPSFDTSDGLQPTMPQTLLEADDTSNTSKLRVLAVHGASSNSAIMRFQVRRLKAALEKRETTETSVEWIFVDSPRIWTPVPGAKDPIFGEPGDFEKSLSKGQPFRSWYSHGSGCYNEVDQGVGNLLELIQAQPVDVLVCFSQASNCVSLLLDALRKKEENERTSTSVPWSLTVMFSGGQIDDPLFQWPEWPTKWTSSHPTVRVFNAGQDDFFSGSEASLKQMYPEILELSHSDGHMFPHTEPRASDIYNAISREIFARCGKKACA